MAIEIEHSDGVDVLTIDLEPKNSLGLKVLKVLRQRRGELVARLARLNQE